MNDSLMHISDKILIRKHPVIETVPELIVQYIALDI